MDECPHHQQEWVEDHKPSQPEIKLWRAVLIRLSQDYKSSRKKILTDAKLFLNDQDSLSYICDLADIEIKDYLSKEIKI